MNNEQPQADATNGPKGSGGSPAVNGRSSRFSTTPDPKLVEALDDLLIDETWWMYGREVRQLILRDFFAAHRLVQLPEEPSGWTDRGWASCFGDPDTPSIQVYRERRSWMDPLPIYILHGDPKEVDDG